jgi:nucleolar protein 14
VDQRFGEKDATMSLEERMLERFTRKQHGISKAAVFNLEDEEELTHYGQSLSEFDDFDDDAEDNRTNIRVLPKRIAHFV